MICRSRRLNWCCCGWLIVPYARFFTLRAVDQEGFSEAQSGGLEAEVGESSPGGEVAAHAVHPTTRRGGGGAQIQATTGRSVGRRPGDRTGEDLGKIHAATVDVSADQVGVSTLERSGRKRASRQDAIAEPGRKALHLALDSIGRVDGRAVRQVAIGPGRVPPFGSAARVEHGRLHEQYEWPVVHLSMLVGGLRRGNLLECAAQMDGRGPKA